MRDQTPPTWVKTLVRHLLSSKFIAASALVGAVLLAPGCSDLPTSPGNQLSQEDGPSITSLDDVIGQAPRFEWTVTKKMRARGGSIKLDGQRLVCTIPNGALPTSDEAITAKMRRNGLPGFATRVTIDFQPSIVFLRPITLKMDSNYLAGTGNTYILWYFDPVGHTWIKQSEKTFASGSAPTFAIDHYSIYALTR
jgi:hypothetical protein